MLIDLHTHTSASDGTDSPEGLVRRAALAGLSALSVTDHDTTSGLPAASAAGAECGLEMIRGCEISSATPYGEMHILGLWLPDPAPALESVLRKMRDGRRERNRGMVDRLKSLGLDISLADVESGARGSVGRPHIARALVAKGHVASINEAFRVYLGRGGRAWLPRTLPDPVTVIRLLADLGACVSLAHPFLMRCPESWLEEQVASFAGEGLTALEAWHSEHTEGQIRQCLALARRYGLCVSGGTDYHGENKPGLTLGRLRDGRPVPHEILDDLKTWRIRHGLSV